MQDQPYGVFTQKLIPTLPKQRFIGVRIPKLRALAKELSGSGEARDFIQILPHEYHEENMLHAFLIEEEKNFEQALALTEAFLPYIDNWAVCDSFSPKLFKRRHKEMLPHILRWLEDVHPYTQRFGMGLLLSNYLNEHFEADMLDWVSSIESQEYYVRMMQAWYFATALTKQYEASLPFIETNRLERWTHNKTIQKSIESRLIPQEHKQFLRSLKRKQKP